MKVNVILGLQYGDEAKAKCAYTLAKTSVDELGVNGYKYVVRFNGGPNAGHTIYHNNQKFVTHQVPVGVFFDIPSIIGPCSVVDLFKLQNEVDELSTFLGKDISSLILIDKRTHIITETHKTSDFSGSIIGSTKSGIAYAYADKHLRTGRRYGSLLPNLIPFKCIDILDILKQKGYALFEGAQGWGLDIDYGDYPFVTSSHCGIAGVVASGVRPMDIEHVFGIAKIYETYVGNKNFQDTNDPNLLKMQEIGLEVGATTGRKRQCNYINLDRLIESIHTNQVTTLIINKIDVLEQVGVFCFIYKNVKVSFDTMKNLLDSIEDILYNQFKELNIIYSSNPYTI